MQVCFVQVISPFLDPVTRSKIVFIDAASEADRRAQLAMHVSASAVAACAGNNANNINVEAYGQRMQKLDEERSASYDAFQKASGIVS